MSESSEEKCCPTCGSAIPAGSPQGLCPRCILQGVAGETDANTGATRTAVRPGLEAPTLEEISAAFPQFEVIELIGSGGMGAVFKVRQPRLDRLVALKVLPRSLAGNAHFTERFTREAQALAKLNHPNIVAVHDFGESGGFHYLLMEYVDGANLREAMRAGRFTPEQAFGVVPKICGALQYAHDEGVLHRDIKPENLLLDTRGRVKIVDFGIAKLVALDDGTSPGAALTGSMAPGTPQYMAPEQIEHPGQVDHRADIYSLGVVFYEMLTGELPIGRFAAPSEKARVGGDVDDIVFRTLEKEPDRRQQSAGEVRTQVEGIADVPPPPRPGVSPGAANSSLPSGGPTQNSRRAGRALIRMGVSAALIGLVWLGGVFLSEVYLYRERVEIVVKHAEADQLQARAAKLQADARAMRQRREGGAESDRLEAEAEATMQQVFELHRSARPSNQPNREMLGLLILCIVVSIVFGVVIIVATVSGWKTLRALRFSGEHRGRLSALIAALTLPVLLVSAAILCILIVPARGLWVGPAISLAVLGILAANTWLILRTWRWLNTPPSATEQAALTQSATLADSFGERSAGSRGTKWVAWLLAIAVGVPILFVGSCVFYLALSHDSSEQAKRQAADKTAAAAAAAKAQALAEAEAVGDDLSTEERKVVGSWHFEQGLDVGDVHFSAERKWRMETADGNLVISGTWKIVDRVLEQKILESSESEQVGRLIRSEILELIDDKKLELRDLEGGDTLTLRPIHAMSEVEKQLLGTWRPPVSDQEETFVLASDRSFEFITSRAGTMRGTWRVTETSDGSSRLNMIVREAPRGVEDTVVFDAVIENRSKNRLEFAAPLYGNEKLLVREIPVDLGLIEARIVGRWEGVAGTWRGRYIFYSDRTFRSESIGLWEQGTWQFLDDIDALEVKVFTANGAAVDGRVIRGDVVEAKPGEQLKLRHHVDREILDLRAIMPLSDTEQRLLGDWRTENSDEEEKFEFWADRRFRVTTPKGHDEGFWTVDEASALLGMVIVSTDESNHSAQVLHGRILKLDDQRFEFENSDGGETKVLKRVKQALLPLEAAEEPEMPPAIAPVETDAAVLPEPQP